MDNPIMQPEELKKNPSFKNIYKKQVPTTSPTIPMEWASLQIQASWSMLQPIHQLTLGLWGQPVEEVLLIKLNKFHPSILETIKALTEEKM
jgi:hypothetical protein